MVGLEQINFEIGKHPSTYACTNGIRPVRRSFFISSGPTHLDNGRLFCSKMINLIPTYHSHINY
jgi:hypothetical protein